MTSDKAVSVEQRLNALINGDTWHTLTLTTWTGTLHYRYVIGQREVMAYFTNANPGGSVGDGTGFAIGTLPAAYSPNSQHNVPLACDVTGSSQQSPHLLIATSGIMTVYGVGAGATAVSLCAVFPVVDD